MSFCVDYRILNAVTHRDAYPLPRIDETLQALSGSQWSTTLDMLSEYWQVGIAEKDKEKTAFVTQEGLFEFKLMPLGLCNTPATFQRLMNFTLAGMLWSECLVYLNDVIVFRQMFEDHLQNLRLVLARQRAVGLKVKPSKCSFFHKQVLYLGHIVSPDEIATDSSKTQKIKDWPVPRNTQDINNFFA